jgi:hyaluronan synthase
MVKTSKIASGNRRQADRHPGGFPVTIHVGEGSNRRAYAAIAKDVSDSGLLLEGVDIPPDEKRFRIDFRIPPGVMPDEEGIGRHTLDAEVRRRDERSGGIGVAFLNPLGLRLARTTRLYLLGAAIVGLLAAMLVFSVAGIDSLPHVRFDLPILLYSLAVGAYLVARFALSTRYQPPGPAAADLPAITVVVPAYNEEAHVARSLTHILESDYPADRMQVIAVNDGSHDGSRDAMEAVRKDFPSLIVVDLPRRQGKRTALTAAARMATGELLVFVDSDSFVRRDALRRLVEGFANPAVGAIAGHCEVENSWSNLLTRVQTVGYDIRFRILKAAESRSGSVSCLSGPLAAYRRDVFLRVVDEWMNQRFLGSPATCGDDHSLTNCVMELGLKVLYDARARVTTLVPETCRQFLRQQMRWSRSWLRESLRAASFMWRKPFPASLTFYAGLLLALLGPVIVFRAAFQVPLFPNANAALCLGGIFLVGSLLSATHLFARRSNLWIYGAPFCFLYLLLLVGQIPLAAASFWTSSWGTRR